MKKSIFALFLSAAAMACAGDFFVSKDGDVWGEAFAWEKNAVPSAPVNLRMSQNSGNLQVDGDRTVQTISVWGKAQNIHLLENSVFMLGSGGFNPQNSSVCVSGSGFFRCAGDNLKVYGGDGGVVNFVSNVELDSIVFDNSRKILKSAKIAMRQPIDRIFKTRIGKDGVYAPLKIAGAKGADCSVSLEGNTTVGDIEVRSNARLTVATDRLFLSGKYKKAEVFDATLELVRKAAPYRFGAKVRLNGGSTLVLRGENPLAGMVNVLFLSGTTNSVVVDGVSRLDGFCIAAGGVAGAKDLRIVLPKKSKGVVLTLGRIVSNPSSKAYLAADTLSATPDGKSVGDVSIAIENFANGAVKVAKGFNNPADYAKIKASGWTNFRVQNGVLVADKANK